MGLINPEQKLEVPRFVKQNFLEHLGDARDALCWSRCRLKTSTPKLVKRQSAEGTLYTLQEARSRTRGLLVHSTVPVNVGEHSGRMSIKLLLAGPKHLDPSSLHGRRLLNRELP